MKQTQIFATNFSRIFKVGKSEKKHTSPQKTSLATGTCENKDFEEIWQIKKAEPPSISSRTLPLDFFSQALSEDDLSS